MQEILIKSHLIIDSIEDKFNVNWCGKFRDVNPLIKNDLPVFVVIGANSRIELNTCDIHRIEECAKRVTAPKGRTAITSDSSHVYIKEVDGKETLMCIVAHTRIKHFIPMYDKVGWR